MAKNGKKSNLFLRTVTEGLLCSGDGSESHHIAVINTNLAVPVVALLHLANEQGSVSQEEVERDDGTVVKVWRFKCDG